MAFQQIIFLLLIQGIYNADYAVDVLSFNKDPISLDELVYSDWLTAFSEYSSTF